MTDFGRKMSKKVLIIIAESSEAVEIVAPADVLRRTDEVISSSYNLNGHWTICFQIEVQIASIHGREPVVVSAGIVICPDVSLAEVKDELFDAVLLPGGEGYIHLASSNFVGNILRSHYNQGKLICTICMSAHVLLSHKIAYGKKLTSYPYLEMALKSQYDYLKHDVVQDENLITSRGPSTVYQFTFKIIENLVGVEKAKNKAEQNLFKW